MTWRKMFRGFTDRHGEPWKNQYKKKDDGEKRGKEVKKEESLS